MIASAYQSKSFAELGDVDAVHRRTLDARDKVRVGWGGGGSVMGDESPLQPSSTMAVRVDPSGPHYSVAPRPVLMRTLK